MAERFDRFTNRARKALQLAQEEAHRLQHNYLGTEHLLLGLLRQGDGGHAAVLARLGVDLNTARGAVEFIIGRGESRHVGEIGLTPRAKKVIELAVDEARRLDHSYIGPEHLLLGLVREGEGIAAGILESLGVGLQDVRKQVTEASAKPGGEPRPEGGGVGPFFRSAFRPFRGRPALSPSSGPSRQSSPDPWRAFVAQVEAANVESLLAELEHVSDEIAYRRLATGPGYEAGVVRFLPKANEPAEGEGGWRSVGADQVAHRDKDVVCHVLQGRGQLRTGSRVQDVAPGDLFRIPARTPHDFSALDEPLILFYASFNVPEPPGP